ncbi:MAG TPA: carbohydrate porin, partial [Rhodocyclaceae bacterium]|nr:carbohydrate porin [Rhodocyclaceae bacterium]
MKSPCLLLLCALAAQPVFAQTQGTPPADHDSQELAAWFQSTWVVQRKSAVNSPYSGPNSLIADQERSYTFTNTAYLGARPWQGGEVYLNVESAQGQSFSGGLVGLGAFTNGELVRGNGTNPTIYRQRVFLRQTWNQGGGSEYQESEANQLAGNVDKNRFVLTVGNFSVLDIFDDNAYAKDPRTQFLNFSFMSYPAFDYAADARGYSWGFAGEWYLNDWVLRFGRMTGPKEPNGLPGDYNIGKHYGDQMELEHAHTLGGQPGKVRLLAWRNRAKLARFDDALASFNANPGADPQAILRVRNGEQIKYGLGVNAEQAVNDSLGVFMRAMKADGHTETYAFVEADASVSFGASLKGTAWRRGQDTVGFGLARNMLSKDRRNYLA